MNREIKFKALRQDGGGWVYGYLFLTRFDNIRGTGLSPVIQVINDTDDGYNGHVVIESTICQFTGLEDKNSKEIYEGDIISTVKNKVGNFLTNPTIGYEDASFVAVDSQYSYEYLSFYEASSEIQVIGNIHD